MGKILKTDDLTSGIGEEIGVSEWYEVTQENVNKFAEVTADHQFIHVDPERAAQTPFGGTIALRGRSVLSAAIEKQPGQFLFTSTMTVEIEGLEKPALIADWLTMIFV